MGRTDDGQQSQATFSSHCCNPCWRPCACAPSSGPKLKKQTDPVGNRGGPRPRKTNSAAAQVIVVNDAAYVVDCGDGVARQLVLAGIRLPQLRHIFLTHQHSDHNADYGNLMLLAWTSGLKLASMHGARRR